MVADHITTVKKAKVFTLGATTASGGSAAGILLTAGATILACVAAATCGAALGAVVVHKRGKRDLSSDLKAARAEASAAREELQQELRRWNETEQALEEERDEYFTKMGGIDVLYRQSQMREELLDDEVKSLRAAAADATGAVEVAMRNIGVVEVDREQWRARVEAAETAAAQAETAHAAALEQVGGELRAAKARTEETALALEAATARADLLDEQRTEAEYSVSKISLQLTSTQKAAARAKAEAEAQLLNAQGAAAEAAREASAAATKAETALAESARRDEAAAAQQQQQKAEHEAELGRIQAEAAAAVEAVEASAAADMAAAQAQAKAQLEAAEAAAAKAAEAAKEQQAAKEQTLSAEMEELQDEMLRRDIEFEEATGRIMADFDTVYQEKLERAKTRLAQELSVKSDAEKGLAVEAAKREAREVREDIRFSIDQLFVAATDCGTLHFLIITDSFSTLNRSQRTHAIHRCRPPIESW